MKKILIVGGGGREHALAWKVAQSPQVETVYVAPGNAGTAKEPKTKNVAISATDIERLISFAKENHIDLTIVGPEAPLSLGIVDEFQQTGLQCFGPHQATAQLEASKAFSKAFMKQHHIPTAEYATFSELTPAIDYVQKQTFPLVIKASGLAAGKGVVIAQSQAEAIETLEQMLSGHAFGNAGREVVIEEFLTGEEASFMVISDGKHVLPLATSQDHKSRDEGDQGPNTGGMGAYSPAPVITPDLQQRILQEVIMPVIQGMAKQGTPYIGFLYAGLMIQAHQDIKVLEFNCRLGDPETEPLMMRLQSDLVTLCLAALNEQLHHHTIEWDSRVALGVVLTAGGYPHDYQQGDTIQGLDQPLNNNCKIFHCGTVEQDNQILTAGGRVLCVTALAPDVQQAQQEAYAIAKKINWKNIYYRRDIGYRAILKDSNKS